MEEIKEIIGYSIFKNGEFETFVKGVNEYSEGIGKNTLALVKIKDRKSNYELKKVMISYIVIE